MQSRHVLLVTALCAIALQAIAAWVLPVGPVARLLVSSVIWMAAWAFSWGIGLRAAFKLSRAEQRLERLEPLEKDLAQQKETFLSHVSHEFRSPLASLIGYLDLLVKQSDGLTERHREYVRTMQESAHRLKSFTDNILSLTKLVSGMSSLQTEPVAPLDIFEKAVSQLRPLLAARRLNVSFQCAEDLCVSADEGQLMEVTRQVLSNAAKFTEEGGRISLWGKMAGGGTVAIGISDSGVGIPPAMFERVFEKFEQVEETHQRMKQAKGAGLGLAIARRLIEAQGGKIWIQESSEKGTTVAWTLPTPTPQDARQARESDRLAA
jgi:signal transduction histidine kinase